MSIKELKYQLRKHISELSNQLKSIEGNEHILDSIAYRKEPSRDILKGVDMTSRDLLRLGKVLSHIECIRENAGFGLSEYIPAMAETSLNEARHILDTMEDETFEYTATLKKGSEYDSSILRDAIMPFGVESTGYMLGTDTYDFGLSSELTQKAINKIETSTSFKITKNL